MDSSGDAPNATDKPFRVIAEDLAAAIYATDATGMITYYNAAAAEIWGRRPGPGEARWCGSWRLYWPDGRPMAHEECPLAMALVTGEPIEGMAAIVERPDGTRTSLLAHPTPVLDATGDVTGAVNVLVPLGAGREAQALPHDAEARYRELLQTLRVSVWEEDYSSVLDWLDERRSDGVRDLRAYLEAHPECLPEVIDRVRVMDVNDYTLELFEAAGKAEVLASLRRIFLPESDPIFIEQLVALWEGRRTVEGEKAVRTIAGRRLDVMFSIAFEGERCERTLVTLLDISAKNAAERSLRAERRRFETLNQVAQTVSGELDIERVVQTATDVATDLSGARFGAFFYNVIDDKGESLLLYTLSGAPRSAFEKFGLPRNTAVFDPTFRGEGVVRSDDIRKDPRYGRNAPHNGMPEGHLPVVSYLAVPVVSRSGEVLGGLFFGHPKPGVFTEESELLVSGVAAHAAIALDNARLHEAAHAEIERRQRAEEARELLLGEIKHRVKNTLATIQGVATQTFRSAAREEHDAFVARLQALAGAHDLLTDQDWGRARVGDVLERALEPFRQGSEERIRITGAEAWLDARKAVLLAMALHELATNAIKYGALAADGGRVDVDWRLEGERRLRLEWRESGGPPVREPTRKGFGTRLIEQALRGEEGGASFTFARQGLVCMLEIALD